MKTVKEIVENTSSYLKVMPDGKVEILDETAAREGMCDLVRASVFGENDAKTTARWLIRATACELGAIPASIHDYYMARSKGEYQRTTVPAINSRGITYDFCRAVFKSAKDNNVGAIIVELAKSESGYTDQAPSEFAPVVMAAAVREGFTGPLFIQGDHYQVKMKKYQEDPEKETAGIKALIKESIDAGYYNIDIDTSTTVILEKPTVKEQQHLNSLLTAQLTAYIRNIEPEGITVSIGGEIGEIGSQNSTPEEVTAYMEGTKEIMDSIKPGLVGPSKISVQTGTAHGGIVDEKGNLVSEVNLDFDVLRECGAAARELGMGGVVQHGASTLPRDYFHKFPEYETLEVHLATGFQNIMYESGRISEEFKNKVYDFIRENFASEKKEGMTDELFIYKTRKKGFGGEMKSQWWNLDDETRSQIRKDLEEEFTFMYQQLGATDTTEDIAATVKPIKVVPPVPEALKAAL